MPPQRRTSQRSGGLKRQRADGIQLTTDAPNESRRGELQSEVQDICDEIIVNCGNVAAQSEPKSRDRTMVMASDLTARLAVNDVELINLRNARDLAAATRSAEQLIRANRTASTRQSYNQKTERWKQWCTERHFEDHDTVTENKLFFYLSDKVIPNGVQTRGKRKGAALSESGLDGYIKPVVALYKVFPLTRPFLIDTGASPWPPQFSSTSAWRSSPEFNQAGRREA